jgi:hypothetical protein
MADFGWRMADCMDTELLISYRSRLGLFQAIFNFTRHYRPQPVISSGAKRSRKIWSRVSRYVSSQPDLSARPAALVEMTKQDLTLMELRR